MLREETFRVILSPSCINFGGAFATREIHLQQFIPRVFTKSITEQHTSFSNARASLFVVAELLVLGLGLNKCSLWLWWTRKTKKRNIDGTLRSEWGAVSTSQFWSQRNNSEKAHATASRRMLKAFSHQSTQALKCCLNVPLLACRS